MKLWPLIVIFACALTMTARVGDVESEKKKSDIRDMAKDTLQL